jgi:hypothetical protein
VKSSFKKIQFSLCQNFLPISDRREDEEEALAPVSTGAHDGIEKDAPSPGTLVHSTPQIPLEVRNPD